MNKQELIATVADTSGLGKGDASKAVEAVPTRPPNSGMMQVVPAGCAPRVSTSRM